MSTITYHESYGEVSAAQLRAYRKYNVSPSDHDSLIEIIGEENHDVIVEAVKEYSPNGSFNFINFVLNY